MNKNFKLVKRQKIKHPKAEFSLLEHKSGAKIYLFKNKDKHRFFAIDFVTLPKTDKGEPHVLEHSLLYGSKKYPSQDADMFSILLRRRQMLEMNASTYPDKTNYYFSSINRDDFLAAMDVYLDGIFNPEILYNKNIFRNEAWRIEKQGETLRFSGVVLNEMLSSFVSPFRIFDYLILKKMFATANAYQVEQGGDPNYITDLKYEELVDFYKTFYGTKNAKIFLYGDIGEKELSLVDSFLSNHFKGKKHKIKAKKNQGISRGTVKAPVQEEDGKFAMVFYGAKQKKVKENLKLSVLLNSLTKYESDFLKQKIKSAGLSKDVFFEFEPYTPLNLIYIYFDGISPKNFKKAEKLVLNSLKEAESKISIDRVSDSLDTLIFSLEKSNLSEKKGEVLYNFIHPLWHYDEYLENIDFLEILKEIKQEFKKDKKLFNKLFKKYFVNSKNYGVFGLKPDPKINLLSRFEKKQKALLNLKGVKLKKIEQEIKEFEEFKNKKINDSVIKPTPSKALKVSLVPRKVKKYSKSGFKVFYSSNNSDIARVDLYLNLSHLTLKELQRLSVLLSAFKFFDSKELSLAQINEKMSKYAKVFSLDIAILKDEKGKAKPFLHFHGESFKKDIKELADLVNIKIRELLLNKESIKQAIKEELNAKKEALSAWYSHRNIAISFALSFKDESHFIKDAISGIRYFEFLNKEMQNDKLNAYENIYKKLTFGNERYLTLSSKEDLSFKIISAFGISNSEMQKTQEVEKDKKQNNLFVENKHLGGAQNFLVFNFDEKYFPQASILKHLLSYGFLFKEIREKGGAYGAQFNADRFGNAYFASWSDSNIKRTYGKFEESLEDFNASDIDFKGAKARALLVYDSPEHELSYAHNEFLEYFAALSFSKKKKERDKIYKATIKESKNAAKHLLESLKKAAIKISFAPKAKDKDLFDEFMSLNL